MRQGAIPLKHLLLGASLPHAVWRRIFLRLFRGELELPEIKLLLLFLARKGENSAELIGCVEALRILEPPRSIPLPFLIDVCGTGGDRKGTFNISTVTGFVVAAAGGYVAKHGNRAVSSQTGSSDVMEALGVRIDASFNRMIGALKKHHFGYFHAPFCHPVFSRVQSVRRELGVRTLFNVLGPLVNPVELSYQMIGVSNPQWLLPVARALAAVGRKKAAVFHSEDGLDELSTHSVSRLLYVERHRIQSLRLEPRKFGFQQGKRTDYAGGDSKTNVEIARGILQNRIRGPKQDVILFNSGLALWLMGIARTLREGIERSRWAVESGRAARVLGALAEYTRRRN